MGWRLTVRVLVVELQHAIAVMVGQAKRAEDSARRRATEQPIEPDAAHRLYGEVQQLRESAEGVASAVARLTAVLPPEQPR
jgi:hypothetical protein